MDHKNLRLYEGRKRGGMYASIKNNKKKRNKYRSSRKKGYEEWGCNSMVEHLSNMFEILGFNLSTGEEDKYI